MENLVEAYEREKDVKVRERILAVKMHVVDGMKEVEVARVLNKGYSTVRTWVRKFRKGGIESLRDRPRSGRPRKAEKEEVERILEDGPRNYGIQQDFWTVKALKVALLERGVEYRKSRLYELVHELGYDLVTPRPTNVKAQREEWDDFKKK